MNDGNQIPVRARGSEGIHMVNGHVMSMSLDADPTKFRKNGLIGVRMDGTGTVSFRHLWIKMIQ
jgi:hypothetical protein